VPVRRAVAAVERVVATYQSSRASAEERFFAWVHRQANTYFNELLADLVDVQPDAVEELLQDYGEATDFKPAQLGGGECAGATQVFIGATFFAAAHERRYRDAFLAQHRAAPAIECATNDVRLIAQGIHDLLNTAPSFKVKRTIDDLAELAEALAAKAPAHIVEPLSELARTLVAAGADPERARDTDWTATFARSDDWVRQAAAFCTEKDSQLDLFGALPGDRASARPIVFHRPLRRQSSPSSLSAIGAAEVPLPSDAADLYEPMYHD